MDYWYYFWVLDFVGAAIAFAFISLLVLVKGVMELKEMFRALQARGQPMDSPSNHFD